MDEPVVGWRREQQHRGASAVPTGGLAEQERVRDAAHEDGHWVDHVYFSVSRNDWPQPKGVRQP